MLASRWIKGHTVPHRLLAAADSPLWTGCSILAALSRECTACSEKLASWACSVHVESSSTSTNRCKTQPAF